MVDLEACAVACQDQSTQVAEMGLLILRELGGSEDDFHFGLG